MKQYSEKTWKYISAYGHGYAYGRMGLELDNLWHIKEKGILFEKAGWNDGLNDFEMFGALKGEIYDDSHDSI